MGAQTVYGAFKAQVRFRSASAPRSAAVLQQDGEIMRGNRRLVVRLIELAALFDTEHGSRLCHERGGQLGPCG